MTATTKTAPRRAKAAPDTTPPRAKRSAKRASTKTPLKLLPPTDELPASPARKPPTGKLGIVVGLMRRPEGATVAQMSEATDWLPHSVRGALAGALKNKHKLVIASEPAEGGRVYRVVDAAA